MEFKKSNYRKKYLEYFGLEDDKNFQIHHLDFNNENNDINNLVLIPKELHQDLHNAFLNAERINKASICFDVSDFSRLICNGYYIKKFIDLSQEVFSWAQLKQTGYDNSNVIMNIYYRRNLYLEGRISDE